MRFRSSVFGFLLGVLVSSGVVGAIQTSPAPAIAFDVPPCRVTAGVIEVALTLSSPSALVRTIVVSARLGPSTDSSAQAVIIGQLTAPFTSGPQALAWPGAGALTGTYVLTAEGLDDTGALVTAATPVSVVLSDGNVIPPPTPVAYLSSTARNLRAPQTLILSNTAPNKRLELERAFFEIVQGTPGQVRVLAGPDCATATATPIPFPVSLAVDRTVPKAIAPYGQSLCLKVEGSFTFNVSFLYRFSER